MMNPAWNVVRVGLGVVLGLMQPAVLTVCSAIMLLGITAAVVFEVSAAADTFPLWKVVGISLGFGVFAVLHAAGVAWLTNSRDM